MYPIIIKSTATTSQWQFAEVKMLMSGIRRHTPHRRLTWLVPPCGSYYMIVHLYRSGSGLRTKGGSEHSVSIKSFNLDEWTTDFAIHPLSTKWLLRHNRMRNKTQLICFWTLSIVLLLLKTQRFGDCILSPSSGGTYSVSPNRQS
jgi:hypothetical protein